MKKKALILVTAMLFVFSMAYAVEVDSGTLRVYGKIETGGVSFYVNQTSDEWINLVSNTEVQPSGTGVEIGNWVFQSILPEDEVGYAVTYKYGDMELVTDPSQKIDYEILEKDTGAGTSVLRTSNSAYTWTAPETSSSVTRVIAVRLTADGRAAVLAAESAGEYSSDITITLTTT